MLRGLLLQVNLRLRKMWVNTDIMPWFGQVGVVLLMAVMSMKPTLKQMYRMCQVVRQNQCVTMILTATENQTISIPIQMAMAVPIL